MQSRSLVNVEMMKRIHILFAFSLTDVNVNKK